VVRTSQSDWAVFTGGTAGIYYKNESTTLRDAGSIYRVEWSTPPMTFENPRSVKRYDKMWLVLKPVAFETISVNMYIDDRSLTGGFYVVDEYGEHLIDENGNEVVSEPSNPWEITMTGAENILKNYGDDIGAVGTRIQSVVYNKLGEKFFISQLIYDLLEMGSN
jgi:hypothetical protein